MATVKQGYAKDEHGQWWMHFRDGRRTRAMLRVCPRCLTEFPTWRDTIYCSRDCSATEKQKQRIGTCPWCRQEFELKESMQRFCSHSCAASYRHSQATITTPEDVVPKNAHNPRFYRDELGQWWYQPRGKQKRNTHRTRASMARCERCGDPFLRSVFHKSRWCSVNCAALEYHSQNRGVRSGDKSTLWKGGRLMRKGYVMAYAPDHPTVQGTTRKYVLEHRLVMEKEIGRILLPTESVHHKNGIRDDNRIANLELWSKAHPAGQRVSDKSAEQMARDMLDRMGVDGAQSFTACDLVELANLIANSKGKK